MSDLDALCRDGANIYTAHVFGVRSWTCLRCGYVLPPPAKVNRVEIQPD